MAGAWLSVAAMRFTTFSGLSDPRAVGSMALVHLNIIAYAFCFWMTQPVMPFLSKALGADPVIFGYVQTTFSLSQLIGGPLIGRLCDSRGAHWALALSNLAGAASYILLGLSSTVPMLFFSQVPNLLMHPMHSAQACVTELSSTATRASALGRLSLSYGLGMVLGSLLGGVLSQYVGYHGVALLAGVIATFFAALVVVFVPNPRQYLRWQKEGQDLPPPSSNGQNGGLKVQKILELLALGSVRHLVLLQVLLGLVFSVYRSSLSQALQYQFHLQPREIGFTLAFSGINSVFVNTFIVGPVTQRLGEQAAIPACMAVLTACLVVYCFASSFIELLLIMVPMGAASTISYTVFNSQMTKAVPEDDTGTSIGISHAIRTFSGIFGPPVGGYLLTNVGFHGIGAFCGSLSLAAFVYAQMVLPQLYRKAVKATMHSPDSGDEHTRPKRAAHARRRSLRKRGQ